MNLNPDLFIGVVMTVMWVLFLLFAVRNDNFIIKPAAYTVSSMAIIWAAYGLLK